MDNPLVSVVIPNYNSNDLINSCLESFLRTTYPNLEIVVVDDKSTDDSDKIIESYAQKDNRIKLVSNEQNSGPSKTRNLGIKTAKGKYIAFLETDMEVEPNWLEPLVNKLENYTELGAVQSKVLDLKKRTIISSDGIYYDPHTFWVISKNNGLDTSNANEEKYISTGAVGSVFRKDILDKIGYFDEEIVHNIDDIDLSYRMWLAGYKILLVPYSITYHWTMKPLSIRTKTTASVKSEFYFQKTLRIFLKNYSWGNIIYYGSICTLVFIARAAVSLYKGNASPLIGFFKAYFWQIKMLGNTLSERSRIQKLRKISDKELFRQVGLKGNFLQIYKNEILPCLQRSAKAFYSD